MIFLEFSATEPTHEKILTEPGQIQHPTWVQNSVQRHKKSRGLKKMSER